MILIWKILHLIWCCAVICLFAFSLITALTSLVLVLLMFVVYQLCGCCNEATSFWCLNVMLLRWATSKNPLSYFIKLLFTFTYFDSVDSFDSLKPTSFNQINLIQSLIWFNPILIQLLKLLWAFRFSWVKSRLQRVYWFDDDDDDDDDDSFSL